MKRRRVLDSIDDQNIDLNSLLDIVFILLIFTMLSMELGRLKSIELEIPEIQDQRPGKEKENFLEVYLYPEGILVFQGNQYLLRDGETLSGSPVWLEKLKRESRPLSLLVLVDKKVYYDDFLYFLNYLQGIQPESLRLGYK